MRRIALVLSLALLGLMLAAPVQAAAPMTAFTGEWIGHDPGPSDDPPGDGSTVHLYVFGGSRPQVVFTDEFGTVCVNNDAPTTFFTSVLRGHVDGDTLSATFNVAKCGPVTLTFLSGASAFWVLSDGGDSDPTNDTLWDGLVTWTRV